MIEEKVMKIMETIEYGVPNELNQNLLKIMDEEKVFYEHYKLQTPEELMQSKMGVCWDQVELERFLFEQNNIKVESYWICTYDGENLPSHTFLTFEKNNNSYWFENSWKEYKGINKYKTKKELLKDIKEKFTNSHKTSKDKTLIYRYEQPHNKLNCKEYYNYIETEGIIINI